MQFEHLWVLGLALPVAVLVWILLRQRTDIGHSSFTLFKSVLAIDLGLIQRVLALAFVVLVMVVLSKPYNDMVEEIVTVQEGRELVFLLDTSGSMASKAADSDLKKIEIAKRVLADFIKGRNKDRNALISFADQAQLEWPLSFAEQLSGLHDPILARLESLEVRGGTNIARALLTTLDHFEVLSDREAKGKAIILVSDGVSYIKPHESEEITSRLQEGKIRLYWVFVKEQEVTYPYHMPYYGSSGGSSSSQNKALTEIAEASGGKVFETAPEEIATAIAEIGKLEANPIIFVEKEITRVYNYRPFLLAALALFIPFILIELVKEV